MRKHELKRRMKETRLRISELEDELSWTGHPLWPQACQDGPLTYELVQNELHLDSLESWLKEEVSAQRRESTTDTQRPSSGSVLDIKATRPDQKAPQAPAKKPPKIHRLPGFKLLSVAKLFSRKIRAEVLEPTIHDLQEEYLEALAQGRHRLARWVQIRGYWSFWSTVFAQIPISLVRKLYDLWKAAGGVD